MSNSLVSQWLVEQYRAGHALCLVLDSQNERDMRQRWISTSRYEQYRSVYGQTPLADLAESGPFIFTFEQPDDRRLDALLERPHSAWGWLASLAQDELQAWVSHWQQRLVVGSRPHQALYRFHDNRVLARALEQLPEEALPAYLGQAISVCYWQDGDWQQRNNPAPGLYPPPDPAPWLEVPTPAEQASEIRLANAHRFLLAGHVEAYASLAATCHPQAWLRAQLAQVDAWNWRAPQQLEFLLLQSLQAPGHALPAHWQASPEETPDEHFERVYQLAQHWRGAAGK